MTMNVTIRNFTNADGIYSVFCRLSSLFFVFNFIHCPIILLTIIISQTKSWRGRDDAVPINIANSSRFHLCGLSKVTQVRQMISFVALNIFQKK